MELRLNHIQMSEESRPAGIRMVLLTLRMMEHWRRAAGDYNSAMILLAIVAISSEKLTRVELPPERRVNPVMKELNGAVAHEHVQAASVRTAKALVSVPTTDVVGKRRSVVGTTI